MPDELVFTVQPGVAQRAQQISLAEAGLRERADLQEWIRENPEILGDGVRIVTFEFGAWRVRDGHAADRLDLLGLDDDGRLVVAELKRGLAPDTVEMQAIKYAAFASRFTPQTLAESHAAYLSAAGGAPVSVDAAREQLEEHAGGELDPDLLRRPRIALVAASFPARVTASAVWLTEMGISVSLIEFNAYRTAHDIVLTVSQSWPIRDVEDFTVSPRHVDLEAAEERVRSRREASAVTTLVADGTIDEGALLELDSGVLPARLRDDVDRWVDEDHRRGRAAWRNDTRAPLLWEVDGESYNPTALVREIVGRATGEHLSVLRRGPRAWRTEEGSTLPALAGIRAALRGRDWTDLHDVLAAVRAGEWTSYGDLSDAIGSSARAVGGHVLRCPECTTGYRVLTGDGRFAEGFTWGDPSDTRDPVELLAEEGVAFTAGRADQERRVHAATLRARVLGESVEGR